MVGGVWVKDNMVRPGAYINVKTNGSIFKGLGSRGVVALPLSLNWGASNKVTPVELGSNFESLLGYDLNDPQLLLVREALKRSARVLVYRLNTGSAASATLGNLFCTAVCSGTRGNDLKVVVAANPDLSGGFIVSTYLSGIIVDKQAVTAINQLKANDFIKFSGSGVLAANPGLSLSGGVSGTVAVGDYSKFFSFMELEDFQVIALPVTDAAVKASAVNFVQRMREVEGKKIQLVLADYQADYEGVISVKNGVILTDGIVIDNVKAVAWVAGATAAAQVNQSNTHLVYDGSRDVDTRYVNSSIISHLNSGQWVFTPGDMGAFVEQDINSFVGFSPEKSSILRKNRVLRVIDTLALDIQALFNNYYLGKVNNNADGRNLFKAEIIKYLESLEAIGAIKNLDKEKDVVVSGASEGDSILVDLAIMPVDSIEKLYMTVTVS